MTVRPEKFVGTAPLDRVRDVGVSGVRKLTSFVDTAVPALLLLTLIAGEQNNDSAPDLKRLAAMLSELQEATEGGGDGPDSSAVGRLYRAVMSLRAQGADH